MSFPAMELVNFATESCPVATSPAGFVLKAKE
jgi:hypothetical protein